MEQEDLEDGDGEGDEVTAKTAELFAPLRVETCDGRKPLSRSDVTAKLLCGRGSRIYFAQSRGRQSIRLSGSIELAWPIRLEWKDRRLKRTAHSVPRMNRFKASV